jgi:hypothetical protein
MEYSIPSDYIIRRAQDQSGSQRTITVRKFQSQILFDRTSTIFGVDKSLLAYGRDFGVVRSFDVNDYQRNIRILCGLVGERNLVLVNRETSALDFLRISNVLLATLMIEFFEDSETGCLGLLVYGGKQGYQEMWRMLEDKLAHLLTNWIARVERCNLVKWPFG